MTNYYPSEQDVADLDRRFTYHPPHGDQATRYETLRGEARVVARAILVLTPKSREQSLALTKLEEAVFWANAAIARNELPADSVASNTATISGPVERTE